MRLWFANFILYSAALTAAGCYAPLTDIGSAVMKMRTRMDKDKKELAEKFSTMPPHAEVPAALRKLRDAGFRLFTFTDNLLEVQIRQLEHGGIVDLFERRFTADGETLQAVARGVRLCRESLRSSVLSPATHGTPSAPSRRAARQR